MKPCVDRIIELCMTAKQNKENDFYEKIANEILDEYGILYSKESIRGISKRYRLKHGLDENFNPISDECPCVQTSNTVNISDYTQPFTEEELLEIHGYDSEKFTIVNSKSSVWTGADGKELSSSRITVKPKDSFVWTQETIDKIIDGLNVPPDLSKYEHTSYDKNGLALVLPIADFHFGLRSSFEATNGTYNKAVARQKFLHIIDDVINRVSGRKISKIFFIIGNDFLNCDNKAGTTTKGTPQDNDGDIESSIIEATDMLIWAIDKIKILSPVDVIHIPSNHDYMVSFGIANALRARYMYDDNIDIDCGFKERKYRKFGNMLLGFAHDIKVQDVNNIVATDARELMSDTTNTIYFLAHLHHEECVDVHGTDVRRLPTISANSRWAYNNGYSSVNRCQSFLISGEFGITDILYTM